MLTDSLLSKIIHTLYFPRAYTILQGSEMLCPFFFHVCREYNLICSTVPRHQCPSRSICLFYLDFSLFFYGWVLQCKGLHQEWTKESYWCPWPIESILWFPIYPIFLIYLELFIYSRKHRSIFLPLLRSHLYF